MPRFRVLETSRAYLCGVIAGLICLAAAACASPPNKEMDQADGAIAAARAAGADRFAPVELRSAADALDRSRVAVTERDYRLALSLALESREHAENAARDAAATQAELRGRVGKSMADVVALMLRANAVATATLTDRLPAARARVIRETLAQLTQGVQEAGAAVEQDDIANAERVLDALKSRLGEFLRTLAANPT